MKPKTIVQFEWLLLAALAIDLINNLAALPMFTARLAARGVAASPMLLLASCLVSPLIGLLLWYFIARRASIVAKWILTVLVAIAVVLLLFTVLRPLPDGARTIVIVSAVAELLKVLAVTRLFMPAAAGWFARTPA